MEARRLLEMWGREGGVSKKSEVPNPMTLNRGFDFLALSRCKGKNRSGYLCGQPAIKGKTRCHWHGGKSTGPKTTEGKRKVAGNRSNFRHGEYSKDHLSVHEYYKLIFDPNIY
jgi:hypothetical protein